MISESSMAKYGHLFGKEIPSRLMPRARAVMGRARPRGSTRALELFSNSARQSPRDMWMAAGRPGRGPINGRNVLNRTTHPTVSAVRGVGGGIPMPPGRSRFSLAKHGKYVAAGIVGAGTVGAIMRRTGPGVDKTQGRPMGMYGY